MLTKPAVLECARCGKIFIGWQSDARPKRRPMCLKCQARQAWDVLSGAIAPKKGRAAGGARRQPARKPARLARKKAQKGSVARSGRSARRRT